MFFEGYLYFYRYSHSFRHRDESHMQHLDKDVRPGMRNSTNYCLQKCIHKVGRSLDGYHCNWLYPANLMTLPLYHILNEM